MEAQLSPPELHSREDPAGKGAAAAVCAPAGAAAEPPAVAPAAVAEHGEQLASDDAVTLLIGPQSTQFVVSRGDLLHHRATMLGAMFSDANRPLWEGKGPHRFPDRDPAVFASVAAFYATGGELTPPSHHPHVYHEYDFWRVEPVASPLLSERSDARGLAPVDQLDALVQLVVDELHDDVVWTALTGSSQQFYIPRPVFTSMQDFLEAVRMAKSPSLFDDHSPSACVDCLAGRVTHFWPSDVCSSFAREALEVKVVELQRAEAGSHLAEIVARAANNMHDSITAKALLSGNKLFLHRLRVALAQHNVEVAIEPFEIDSLVNHELVRLAEPLKVKGYVAWFSEPLLLRHLTPDYKNKCYLFLRVTLNPDPHV